MKGLNIFNSKYVLARPDTATDTDFQAIEEVVGHEYFHNWTGNRVTCRDWFQLSLKEGLTVFRDQEFAADMTSRAVKRIDDVRLFRNTQFPEDSGPMAHPVRPDSYVEINNFYTTTVYNKGAEVIRMYQTLLGPDLFREGVQLYLERHDGEAATTDDFLGAMADAGGVDLDQFRLWYSQAGTPELEVETDYDTAQQTFRLTVHQSIPPTPGQPEKKPMLIPFAVGLVGPDGQDLPLQLTGENRPAEDTTRVLPLREAGQSFTFVGVAQEPILSPLRGFSAPVKLKMEHGRDDLAFRLAHDSDPFNRWEAGQQLSGDILLELVGEFQASRPMVLPPVLVEAFAAALTDQSADPALIAQTLTLPTESFMAEQMKEIDPEAIHEARQFARRELARQLRGEWDLTRQHLKSEQEYSLEPAEMGRRSLKNLALAYLALLEDEPLIEMVMDQFRSADNMTDTISALACLVNSDSDQREEALAAFYYRWQDDPLVVDKWFALQATSSRPDALDQVKKLMEHAAFDIRNPNRVRSLIGAFSHGNPARFHDASGKGYRFLADQVLEIDRLNPQVAARLATVLTRWRRYDPIRSRLMRGQLERFGATPGISRDLGEVVDKALG
ncbi:MAG: aminopeptidase N [Desulfuromonadales bacterium]